MYLNCGSAVVLPEVFLKAVALARNRGIALAGLTTVNLDFVRQYRPQTNVVTRPTAGTGRGYSLDRPPRDHDSAAGGGDRRSRADDASTTDDSFPIAVTIERSVLTSKVPAGVAQLVRARVS